MENTKGLIRRLVLAAGDATSTSKGVDIAPWKEVKSLASHLAPLLEHYEVKWRGHGYIYVDHERHNIDTANRILLDLSLTLGVSTPLVRARLVEFGWLRDVRNALPPRMVRAPEPRKLSLNDPYGRD
ncbi:hypothetical protein [Pseudomonas sp. SDO5271_S396]